MAGIATLEMIEHENLLDRARTLSEIFRTRLTALMQQCDAVREVRAQCAYTTSAAGGHGAVREICDLILAARTAPGSTGSNQ